MVASSERTAVLHIGTEKTGTTTIQSVLAEQREALLGAGACYPVEPGRGWGVQASNHHALAMLAAGQRTPQTAEFFRLLDRGGSLDHSGLLGTVAERISAELASLPDAVRTVVFSTEFLHSRVPRREQVERLRDFLAPHFGAFRVVVYLRRQDQLAVSRHSTMLRNGRITPLLPEPQEAAPGYYDYDMLLRRWEAAFGQASLVPRIFDRSQLEGGDVVRDFARVAGVTLSLEGRPRADNASLSRLARAVLMRVIAARGAQPVPPTDLEMRRLAGRLAARLDRLRPGPSERPTRAAARQFLDHFAASNEAIRQRYFPDRETLFDETLAELPEAEAPADGLGPAEIEATLIAMLYPQGGARAGRVADGAGPAS